MSNSKQNSKKQSSSQEAADLEQQISLLTDALKRERADSENLRRRHSQDIASINQSIKADIAKNLLPVIDNFERSLNYVPKDIVNHEYVKGVQAIVKQFYKYLEDIGIARIKTVGEEFNPHLHEAISMDDSGNGSVERVSEELQSGYRLGEFVIRPAMVRVKLNKK